MSTSVPSAASSTRTALKGSVSGSDLRVQLGARTRDAEADLRARIAAAEALAKLGDRRFEKRTGADGEFVMPMMVEIPGGTYVIGENQAHRYEGEKYAGHVPQHETTVAQFALGRFPVTNAEWGCFMVAGGATRTSVGGTRAPLAPGGFVPTYGYLYDQDDGREDPDTAPTTCRVLRDGSWSNIPLTARASFRLMARPDFATFGHGMRLALARFSPEGAPGSTL